MTPPNPMTAPAGNIYDLGYRRYEGPRLARPFVALGLLRQSLREAYGIGRGGRAKIAPFVLLALAVFPAILAVALQAFAAQAGVTEQFEREVPIRHDTYQSVTSTFVMLFVAAQAPELFGRDLRYGVLPLYFSRVLTRIDYALGRTGGLVLAVVIVTLVPQILLSIGMVLASSDPVTGIGRDLPQVPRYLAVSLLTSGLLAGPAAVIAAYTPRRAYAVASIIALFIVPPIVVGLISTMAVGDAARVLHLVSLGDVAEGLNAAIFGVVAASNTVVNAGLPGWVYVVTVLVVIGGSLAIVLRRYLTIAA